MPSRADDPITPQQCAAARAYLGWKQSDLAAAVGVTKATIYRFERSADPAFALARKYKTTHTVKAAIARALEQAGMILEDGGVRPR